MIKNYWMPLEKFKLEFHGLWNSGWAVRLAVCFGFAGFFIGLYFARKSYLLIFLNWLFWGVIWPWVFSFAWVFYDLITGRLRGKP